jgi:hypothetical protein
MVATWPSMQTSEAWKTDCQYPRLAGSLAKVSISPKLWLLRLTVTEGQDTLKAPTSRCVMPYASIQLATSDVLLMYGQPALPVTHCLWPILARAMRRGQQPWHASWRCTWCVPSRRCTVGEGYHRSIGPFSYNQSWSMPTMAVFNVSQVYSQGGMVKWHQADLGLDDSLTAL